MPECAITNITHDLFEETRCTSLKHVSCYGLRSTRIYLEAWTEHLTTASNVVKRRNPQWSWTWAGANQASHKVGKWKDCGKRAWLERKVRINPRFETHCAKFIAMMSELESMRDRYLRPASVAKHHIEWTSNETRIVRCAPYKAGPNAPEIVCSSHSIRSNDFIHWSEYYGGCLDPSAFV